jgi:hypothetical protein
MIHNHKIPYLLSVLSVLVAYLLHPYLWHHSFYHLTALSFCLIHYSQYLQAKGNHSLFVFVVFIVTINNLLDELFFDPKKIDYNEIITALIIAVIVWTFRKKWIKNDSIS